MTRWYQAAAYILAVGLLIALANLLVVLVLW